MADRPVDVTGSSEDRLVDPAIDLVTTWLQRAARVETREQRVTMRQLRELVTDDRGVDFVMKFVDRVARPDSNAVAAGQLASLVRNSRLPGFLSSIDKFLLHAAARLAPVLPA